MPFAAHRGAHQVHVPGPGLLQAGADGARRQGVRRLQVPLDVPGRRGRHRPDLGARRRPALHAGRQVAAPPRPRRAAAALERAARRHVDRRARGPERPYFVEQFKHRIPQYMLRHKVKAGITGWAQVNGWRGNTSLEKRIEYDLYYIENWSVGLDIKIMCLTVAARAPEARVLADCQLQLPAYRPCQESSSPAPPASSAPICPKRCSTAASRSSASTTC